MKLNGKGGSCSQPSELGKEHFLLLSSPRSILGGLTVVDSLIDSFITFKKQGGYAFCFLELGICDSLLI